AAVETTPARRPYSGAGGRWLPRPARQPPPGVCCRVSNDGRRVAVCTSAGRMGEYCASVRLFSGDGEGIATLAESPSLGPGDFTPDGSRLLACEGPGTLRAWDAATGRERFSRTGLQTLPAGLTPIGVRRGDYEEPPAHDRFAVLIRNPDEKSGLSHVQVVD